MLQSQLALERMDAIWCKYRRQPLSRMLEWCRSSVCIRVYGRMNKVSPLDPILCKAGFLASVRMQDLRSIAASPYSCQIPGGRIAADPKRVAPCSSVGRQPGDSYVRPILSIRPIFFTSSKNKSSNSLQKHFYSVIWGPCMHDVVTLGGGLLPTPPCFPKPLLFAVYFPKEGSWGRGTGARRHQDDDRAELCGFRSAGGFMQDDWP